MRRRVQLITLECALIVSEEGSFLGASRRMGMHHSALSRRIRSLEHAVGTILFERHAGGVRPTLAGARLLRNLRRVLTDLDGTLIMEETVRREQVGSPPSAFDMSLHATEFLDAVADFIRSRPDVTLRFVETKRASTRSP
ncbi:MULTISPECIES: LysR family transcriptional regulator [unclassified Mesorhizobium]|uniref:LysR family transcriptional regulator n=1 Tax=unclassified Mesorhizobium TaxID=325217 RepID=UPI000FD2F2E5|nr:MULTISPECIES: LysR family transcriptional regulator [unclassified Mesorhizobium]RVB80595.1 LysR family transcriptional regulator [Mesorhizobium sp. M6A.T.Cr.TU.014.01.1.1]RWQ06451.1 MAG: LysR family transcriptional regulator [Mesorhizobium sp.]RWQ10819.1 MAG: LysR family transcriptional regulator [Mesorhizobium sp.]